MKRRNNEEMKLSDLLKTFVDENKLDKKGLDQVKIRDIWNSQMGPAIEKYTTNIKLKNEVLYVQLSSSVLREELSYGKEKIIRILNEEMGKELIHKLVLR
ncbi:MAG: DUF721 domain-containing protein [Christiangramia sp.]|uniref:Zn-ribbon-containing, RNA-binding protein n=1 Tax=Christiangramia flava JLT2011 TaxID=1229726 RepID=A0A1L7I8D8_9FLAO|nr:DUF721 domain-containing protein [Christiangramia flava]APU69372.1 Zn-ribbon-containing, RNA-binding protein [Christiangramia flava JLT2011]OSS37695.1 hypothetical protein C723_3328 [Christiangramia flava JLT2011]|tara:strand:- start:155 stop:454 length:300 start_codon:yes stop_codon:yes gene_type:complete